MTAIAASPMLRPASPTVKTDRGIEFAVSAALHLMVFAGLSTVLLVPRAPPPPPAPMDVTIADDVGLQAVAPQAATPPAQSQAPDLGAPEDAAPPAPAPEPEAATPAPPKPQPAAAPPPKPAAIAKPQPKKVAPPGPQPVKAPARPAPSAALAKIVGKGSGATAGATTRTPRGSSLGKLLVGLGATANTSKSTTPQGATMSQAAAMDIGQKIKQQVEPCARNQTSPGPGAGRIGVSLRLRFNKDGSLSARPTVEGHTGVDDENGRYVRQVDDRAISAFMACQPLRGLPPQYYDVPNGWANFVLRYRFSGWGG